MWTCRRNWYTPYTTLYYFTFTLTDWVKEFLHITLISITVIERGNTVDTASYQWPQSYFIWAGWRVVTDWNHLNVFLFLMSSFSCEALQVCRGWSVKVFKNVRYQKQESKKVWNKPHHSSFLWWSLCNDCRGQYAEQMCGLYLRLSCGQHHHVQSFYSKCLHLELFSVGLLWRWSLFIYLKY